jgi:hypothetical protein
MTHSELSGGMVMDPVQVLLFYPSQKFCDMFCAFTPPVTVQSEVRKARIGIALSTAPSVCERGQVRALLDQSKFETGFERGKRR